MGSLYNYDTKQAWDDLFEIGAEGAWGRPAGRAEIQLNYHRFVIFSRERRIVNSLASVLEWTADSAVLLVNCGFGWGLDVLFGELGIAQVFGTQVSSYIQENKSLDEDVDIAAAVTEVGLSTSLGDGLTLFNALRNSGNPRAALPNRVMDEGLDSQTSRQTVRTALGTAGYDVVTYDGFLNTHTDEEAVVLSDDLNRMPGVGRVIHVVFNWLNAKTLEEWKAILPSDLFVDGVTYRIL